MTKPVKTTVDLSLVVPIVGDAAIASEPVADGRMLPLLIVDASARPNVAELIRVHAYVASGDAESRWGSSRDNDDHVMLILNFVRPMDLEMVLLFSIERQGMLVDMIVNGRGVYLQIGNPGDRLITNMDAQRVLIEIPESDFHPIWDRLFLDRMIIVLSRRRGVPRRTARSDAENLIAETRNGYGWSSTSADQQLAACTRRMSRAGRALGRPANLNRTHRRRRLPDLRVLGEAPQSLSRSPVPQTSEQADHVATKTESWRDSERT
jgi:hypothetical protein